MFLRVVETGVLSGGHRCEVWWDDAHLATWRAADVKHDATLLSSSTSVVLGTCDLGRSWRDADKRLRLFLCHSTRRRALIKKNHFR